MPAAPVCGAGVLLVTWMSPVERAQPPKSAPTCCTSAPVASQRAEMALLEEMRWASTALAVGLDSSLHLADEPGCSLSILTDSEHFKARVGPTCCTSAPVASQRAEMALMEEMRCASIALAVSLDSSADHRLVVSTRSLGIQCSYTLFSTLTACSPLSVCFPPISTCKQGSRDCQSA